MKFILQTHNFFISRTKAVLIQIICRLFRTIRSPRQALTGWCTKKCVSIGHEHPTDGDQLSKGESHNTPLIYWNVGVVFRPGIFIPVWRPPRLSVTQDEVRGEVVEIKI